MRVTIAAVTPRRKRLKSAAAQALLDDFLGRISQYTVADLVLFDTEETLLAFCDRQGGRSNVWLAILDSRGKTVTSEQFAAQIGRLRDSGTQHAVWAVGPADGWSKAASARADLTLSLGLMTLPH